MNLKSLRCLNSSLFVNSKQLTFYNINFFSNENNNELIFNVYSKKKNLSLSFLNKKYRFDYYKIHFMKKMTNKRIIIIKNYFFLFLLFF